jgi:hypothetical protein
MVCPWIVPKPAMDHPGINLKECGTAKLCAS